jgi:cytochrome c oxidase assembly protein subunit 19
MRHADRGSFPLDHEGPLASCSKHTGGTAPPGECKELMAKYLKCLRKNKNDNTPCRDMTKQYLACRMDKCALASLLTCEADGRAGA